MSHDELAEPIYTDAQRMELRSHVNLAGEVVARLWPMRTFISRNPLQGFEHLQFEEAIKEGERLFAAQGFLPLDYYRKSFEEGRIGLRSLQQALQELVTDKHALLGERRVSHEDILTAVMVRGIRLGPAPGSSAEAAGFSDTTAGIAPIVRWLQDLSPGDLWGAEEEPMQHRSDDWPFEETMAAWCDRTVGSRVTEEINRQMIKWCAVFCDEGEAAWSMPHREDSFFRSWKRAAQYDFSLPLIGIARAAEKIRRLSDGPEDALLASLDQMGIPRQAWPNYLSLHLAALPGWTGVIKWRAEQAGYPWQEHHRIDLIKYLAIRLFYERELAATVFRRALDSEGHVEAIAQYARRFPYALWFRRAFATGTLSAEARQEGKRLLRWWKRARAHDWNEAGRRWYADEQRRRRQQALRDHAYLLLRLGEALGIPSESITATTPSDLSTVASWVRSFPPRLQALKWLEAHEVAHQSRLVEALRLGQSADQLSSPDGVRPLAQFAFCIDVRSEVFRRHLERQGGYETFGFAGFFGLPIAYRSLDEPHEAELCPVLLKPKHMVREVPRAYQGEAEQRRKANLKLVKAGEDLLHDLKHNVVTPYVMVEALGWFFAWPMLGRTLWPRWYARIVNSMKRIWMPPVATSLTVDKMSNDEAESMVAADQRRLIVRWLRAQSPLQGRQLTPERIECIRLQVLGPTADEGKEVGHLGQLLMLDAAAESRAVEALRQACRLTPRDTSATVDRITRTGFTLNEQAYYVETALRLMGFTKRFGRLVFLCGHGSSSENNPYESALDCGACGGSNGLPNARAFAMIANRPRVRELLAQRGLAIPSDTHFVAAVHDTTTDRLRVADVEDVPPTHRKDLAQILEDVNTAGQETAAERYARVASRAAPDAEAAMRAVYDRSVDWSQVRPEWGLARNSAFIIADRDLTRAADLEGRAFLHSYDHASDTDGRLLEFIMTAPLVVAQWINAEYYFSTVDPDRYGSGSKVYHNVTGRIGVMTGNASDLRMGLPVQSLMDGHRPYHEPLRLTAVIEAPRKRIDMILRRQPGIDKLFRNRWLRLVALDPGDRRFYRYDVTSGWLPIESDCRTNRDFSASQVDGQ
jgi:uncharacterized protein YbcC (UPF0753/DUF2309 family)